MSVHEAALLRTILDNDRTMILLLDQRGVVLYANQSMAKFLGRSAEELPGALEEVLYQNAEMAQFCNQEDERLREEPTGTVTEERAMRDADGSLRWLRRRKTALVLPDGQPGVFLQQEDITEALTPNDREAILKRGLRNVIAISEELLFCPDERILTQRAVERARTHIGIDRCSLLLRDGDLLRGTWSIGAGGSTDDESAKLYPKDWLTKLQSTASRTGESWLLRPDPNDPILWTVGTLIRQSGAFIGVFLYDNSREREPFDRTRQELVLLYCSAIGTVLQFKRAEREALESETHFRKLFQQAPTANLLMEPGGRIQSCNPAMVHLLELSGEPELLTMDGRKILGTELFDKCFHHLKHENTLSNLEIALHRPKGGTVPVMVNLAASRDERGNLMGAFFLFLDLSEKKRQAELLLQQREQFLHAQKMEAVGRLAGGIAHDFNNILTSIIGISELILMDLKPGTTIHEDMVQIRQVSERAAGLTRQLLSFGRKQEHMPIVLDANQLLRSMGPMIRPLIGDQIELHYKTTDQAMLVNVDPNQLEQALLNLVINARDAMEQSGRLTLATSACEVEPQNQHLHPTLEPGVYTCMEVRDTGCGMDAATRQRIYEPFFTTKPKGKGTGLGLPTVYTIIQQAGGHLRVESEPGCGTTFQIYLPRVPDSPGEAQATIQAGGYEALAGHECILLVEDQDDVRRILMQGLQRHGYRVLGTNGGAEALAVCREFPEAIDLLITDVSMPGKTGLEVAEEVRRLRPAMRTLYITGLPESGEGMDQPARFKSTDEVLQKPFTPVELLKRIRGMMG